MELAAMLGGEAFSDHPDSVCPVIASFLRAYNDAIGDGRRQDLYALAAKVVGSRSSGEVQRARLERLAKWTSQHRRHTWLRFIRRSRPRSTRLQVSSTVEWVGIDAVRAIPCHTVDTHAEVIALIDELLWLDVARRPSRIDVPPLRDGAEARG